MSTPKKAWQLIEREENWCKGAVALSAKGRRVSVGSKKACKWCAFGALLKRYSVYVDLFLALARLRKITRKSSITDWNDEPERTHAQVLAAMKRADV